MSKHNKKRNTGLLYEFLVRHISECLVEGDEKQARAALKLLRKHILKKGTELHREFRLFNALANTTVDDQSLAQKIVAEARSAAKSYNEEQLDREKSLLIRGINHSFKDPSFYNKRFDEYKVYATIQTLLNEWRKGSPDDVVQLAKYEHEICEWLRAPKTHNLLEEKNDNVDDLVVNLMVKKVNKKYNRVLNPEQIGLIKQYVYSMKSGDTASLKENLETIRTQTLNAVNEYMQEESQAPFVIQKLTEVRNILEGEIDTIDDSVLTRYLRVAQLKHEIMGD